jgi:prepilin-type N-terminal cleavage/methylation domain-containing protein
MQAQLRKRKEGFTIIEVLIVLAIAGLILLVVFLAVPALQRNSRNTQRKNEVASIIGAINEYSNNNGGKLPSVAGTERADAIANAKLSFYSSANISWPGVGAANANDPEAVQVVTGAKCTTGGANGAGSGRQFAVMYTVESGNGTQKLCQDS